jgi:hypothetical protein
MPRHAQVKRSFEKGDYSEKQKDQLTEIHKAGLAATRLAELCDTDRTSLPGFAKMKQDTLVPANAVS